MARTFEVPSTKLKSRLSRFSYQLLKLLSRTKLGQSFLTLSTLFTINQTRQTNIRNQKISFSYVSDTWLPRRFLDVERLEPDTLSWIDEMSEGSMLWDIGANVGGYSIYAAISKETNVYAFEPSPFNLEFLARNIWLNNLEDKITVIPIALSEFASKAPFVMKRIEWAGSGSSFFESETANYDNKNFKYNTISLPADRLLEIFNIPFPNYLKLDVDGIEALILSGAKEVLSRTTSVLVEVQHSTLEKQLIHKCLEEAGLTKQKVARQNEIWIRQ
ncbi:MAG: FkbM family methyltransferase [Acidimicrobiaceae bacterium]